MMRSGAAGCRGTSTETKCAPLQLPGARNVTELEETPRLTLQSMRMKPSDVDCFVSKTKDSRAWQPATLTYSLSAQDSATFVASCGIDLSQLWVPAGD
jgi:uncharacterized circularly permuted ATP-grasp superfamily protein